MTSMVNPDFVYPRALTSSSHSRTPTSSSSKCPSTNGGVNRSNHRKIKYLAKSQNGLDDPTSSRTSPPSSSQQKQDQDQANGNDGGSVESALEEDIIPKTRKNKEITNTTTKKKKRRGTVGHRRDIDPAAVERAAPESGKKKKGKEKKEKAKKRESRSRLSSSLSNHGIRNMLSRSSHFRSKSDSSNNDLEDNDDDDAEPFTGEAVENKAKARKEKKKKATKRESRSRLSSSMSNDHGIQNMFSRSTHFLSKSASNNSLEDNDDDDANSFAEEAVENEAKARRCRSRSNNRHGIPASGFNESNTNPAFAGDDSFTAEDLFGFTTEDDEVEEKQQKKKSKRKMKKKSSKGSSRRGSREVQNEGQECESGDDNDSGLRYRSTSPFRGRNVGKSSPKSPMGNMLSRSMGNLLTHRNKSRIKRGEDGESKPTSRRRRLNKDYADGGTEGMDNSSTMLSRLSSSISKMGGSFPKRLDAEDVSRSFRRGLGIRSSHEKNPENILVDFDWDEDRKLSKDEQAYLELMYEELGNLDI